jgi:hypothetical protein
MDVMLIIAAPKSASTSLMKSLGKRHRVPAKQIVHRDAELATEFPVLGSIHSDVRELTAARAERFALPDRVYKQHIPPTTGNVALLAHTPKVVLVRPPVEIVRAYHRGITRGVHAHQQAFEGIDPNDADAWTRHADESGLLRELQTFCDRWTEPSPDRLVIRYGELIENPSAVIRRIEEFWGWSVLAGSATLAKERYTRHGPLRSAFQYRLYQPMRQIAGQLLNRLLKS